MPIPPDWTAHEALAEIDLLEERILSIWDLYGDGMVLLIRDQLAGDTEPEPPEPDSHDPEIPF